MAHNIQDKITSVRIGWKEFPLDLIIVVFWRGVYFTLNINAHKTKFGEEQTLTFSYKGENYPCKFTKWKYQGGGNGVYPPHIETDTHTLKIWIILGSVELIDEPKKPSMNNELSGNPFNLTYQS